MRKFFVLLCAVMVAAPALARSASDTCANANPGVKDLYWGDLHVHTAYSLDAYGYGSLSTPRDAYRFAKGDAMMLADGSRAQLDRPLDFAAVTDHAEWFDFMYVCSDPEYEDHPDCRFLRDNSGPASGGKVFGQFVVPSITRESPARISVCAENPGKCELASRKQWQRIQQQANEADDPCHFSAIIGFEWSATPSASHMHRNVLFSGDQVTPEAIDYLRFPELGDLWRALAANCDPEQGCDAITIPHNTNLGDGLSFDIEAEDESLLSLRSHYERLVEVHQEKGNSECLSPFGFRDESDCGFEVRLTRNSVLTPVENFERAEWERMRGSYVRALLMRGLAGYEASGAAKRNPLQLGMIGSTDGHSATPGFVEEESWLGSVFGIGDIDRTMTRVDFNPGGLVAVWAEQNTRASLFEALKRREVYATSGPRIRLNFSATASSEAVDCDRWSEAKDVVPMGGEFSVAGQAPQFLIQAQYDRVPLQKVEMVRGAWQEGAYRESVETIWEKDGEGKDLCLVWRDTRFNIEKPAFWYVRVHETPTPRWSAHVCARAGRCPDFPQADVQVAERAWSSPIWYLPGS